jgi:hypothetical protein
MAQDWPLVAHLMCGVLNELKALRADMFGHSFAPVLPPSTQHALDQKRAQIRAAHDDVVAQLRGQRA